MIEPEGPLPSEVYWRRRVVAAVGAVVVIAVVIALIVWAAGSSGDSDPKNAAATSSPSAAAAPPPSSSTQAPASSEPVTGGGDHGSDGGPSSTPAPPPTDAQPADQALQNACADQSLSVVLYTDKPTYTVGDQPVFTVVATNGGLSECARDLGKNAQNVIVRSLDGARTLWAAQDCAPDKSVNVQVLQPGQQFNDTITWSGTTSSAGCKKPRVQIPPGGYQAIAKIGEKESAPITFNVVKPAQQ